MIDIGPVADIGEVLQLLALSRRAVRASRADPGGPLLPTDEPLALVLIDDSDQRVGPDAFPTATMAWLRRRAEVVVLGAPSPPVAAVMALTRALTEGHSVVLILTPPARVDAWREAMNGINVKLVGFDDVTERRTLH
jgi:hypothetical protein